MLRKTHNYDYGLCKAPSKYAEQQIIKLETHILASQVRELGLPASQPNNQPANQPGRVRARSAAKEYIIQLSKHLIHCTKNMHTNELTLTRHICHIIRAG